MFSKAFFVKVVEMGIVWQKINKWISSLPNDKIGDLSKFQAFANDSINVNEQLKYGLRKVENVENVGYQHFLLFPQCFQKASFYKDH